MNFAFLIALIPALLIFFGIPIIIGVYVYRDATRRNMNATLWALVAALAPTLIGFIIYLLVRGSHSDLSCPGCAAPVTEQYVVCPKCGSKLKASCPGCGFPAEPDWTVCPKCAAPLPEDRNDYVLPARKKDKALGKILIAVVLIPVLLMVFIAVIGFMNYSSGGVSGSMSTTYLRTDDVSGNPEITAWIEKCDKDLARVYALRYQAERGEQKETCFLVYIPFEFSNDSVDFDSTSLIFGELYIELKLLNSGAPGVDKHNLIVIRNYTGKYAGLRVYQDGKMLDCEITELDYDPARFEDMPIPRAG